MQHWSRAELNLSILKNRLLSMLDSDLVAVAVVVLSSLWLLSPVVTVDGGLVRRDADMVLLAVDQLQGGLMGEGLRRIAWPLETGAAVTDWVAGQAALSLPLALLGAEPVTLQHFLSLSGVILTALAGFLAIRLLLGRGPHAWIGGVAAGYNVAHIAHLHHINLVHHEAAILGAVLVGLGLVRRHPVLAGAGVLVSGLSAQFGVYMGLHGALMLVALLISAGLHRIGDRRTWMGIAGGGLLAGLTLLPIGVLFSRSAKWIGEGEGDVSPSVWDPSLFFEPSARFASHRLTMAATDARLLPRLTEADPANAGFALLMLSLLGLGVLWGGVRHRFLWRTIIGATLAGMLLALGEEVVWRGAATGIPGPHALLSMLPGLSGLRAPSRWLVVSFTGMGMLSALGAWYLYRRSWLLGVLAVVFVLAERPAQRTSQHTMETPHPDYAALNDLTVSGALWDTMLSPQGRQSACGETIISSYLAAIAHDRPLLGGQYARSLGVLDELNAVAVTWPAPRAVALLDALEVGVVYEHRRSEPVPPEVASCQSLDNHRLCLLRPAADVLPAPEVVTEEPIGAVVGVRWSEPDALPDRITARCGADEQIVDGPLWALISRLRHGPEAGFVEFFLHEACTETVSTDPPGALLYADGEASWLPPAGREAHAAATPAHP